MFRLRQRLKLARGAKGKLQTIIVLIVAMHTRLPSLGQQRPIHDVQFESAYPPIALQLTVHAVQYRADSRIDAPKQVLLRNAIVQSKLIKQTRLVASLPPIIAASSELILGTSGITVRRRSQALFRQHRSFTSFRACASDFRLAPNRRHIAASH